MIRPRLLLSLLVAVLLVVIISPWLSNTNTGNPIGSKLIPSNYTELETLTAPPKVYNAILERPIFNPSRRPMRQLISNVSNQDSMEAILGYKYRGVIKDGSTIVLLLEHHGKIKQLSPGQVIEGWKLLQIKGNAIIFSSGKRRINLLDMLKRSRKKLKRETLWLPPSREKE